MAKFNPLRKRQRIGASIGISIGVLMYILFPLKQCEGFLSLGAMNKGHEKLSCETCHTAAKGTMMQQLSSNIQYAFGQRKTATDFGTSNVDNKKCLACHERPNDRHPTHRFLEPRFQKAIAKLNSSQCETCHLEHNDTRLILDEAVYCKNCHSDLKVKKDPLDVPHQELIFKEEWSTCLQCHDYHGNHLYETAVKMKDTIPMVAIKKYLKGGADPYSEEKKHYPLSEENWRKNLKKEPY